MNYLTFAFDDTKQTVEIIIIKSARNSTEARLELKRLIETSQNPKLRPAEMIYGINSSSMLDPICSISLKDAQVIETILK